MPAFRVEGVIENPESAKQWEYAVVVAIRDEGGEELRRQVVAVGALEPLERRSFTVSVEVFGVDSLEPKATVAAAPPPKALKRR